MDSAYFEDLAGQLYGLLIAMDDRIGREQAQWLYHIIDVGEYGPALEDIAGTPDQQPNRCLQAQQALRPRPHRGRNVSERRSVSLAR